MDVKPRLRLPIDGLLRRLDIDDTEQFMGIDSDRFDHQFREIIRFKPFDVLKRDLLW